MMYFYGGPGNMMWNSGWGFWGFLGGLLHILFGILIVVFIVKIIRSRKNWHAHCKSFTGEKTPLDILKERYAKGEIEKAEFEEKKKDLLQ